MTQATGIDENAILPYDELGPLQAIDDKPAVAPPDRFVQPLPKASRSGGLIAVDCITVFLILLTIPSFFWSMQLFCTILALVSAILLTVYWKLVVWVLDAMGPPDRPHVIAIIKAPERLYCPRCGTVKTQKYCSGCGVNVEKQYGKMVRQLARYAVTDTQEQRNYLELALKQRLEEIAQEQSVQITAAMKSVERNYVMHIVRQAKTIRQYEQRLLEQQGVDCLRSAAFSQIAAAHSLPPNNSPPNP